MKKDIRVYYYYNGILHKYNRLKKTYPNIDEAKSAINKLKYHESQWVLVEYYKKHHSNIIEISTPEGIFR